MSDENINPIWLARDEQPDDDEGEGRPLKDETHLVHRFRDSPCTTTLTLLNNRSEGVLKCHLVFTPDVIRLDDADVCFRQLTLLPRRRQLPTPAARVPRRRTRPPWTHRRRLPTATTCIPRRVCVPISSHKTTQMLLTRMISQHLLAGKFMSLKMSILLSYKRTPIN